jgi:hypothetical protein
MNGILKLYDKYSYIKGYFLSRKNKLSKKGKMSENNQKSLISSLSFFKRGDVPLA